MTRPSIVKDGCITLNSVPTLLKSVVSTAVTFASEHPIVRLSVRLLLSPGSEDLKEQEMSRHQAESS
jgi:hypothetical protein